MLWSRSKKCPNCGSDQYVTAQKRRQGAWGGPITALFMFFLLQVFNLSFTVSLILGITLIIIVLLLNPFLLEFTYKDEGIF
ncbi:hypothetical protein H1D32_02365 [Anaerobacillus sp. CMMVII]|uniref:TIGR04104 family putative zinc finger protein n=1 Tax=Anaerobacillus sp. CMMVII TaxID=2755588 RepID=UPI0021C50064|nr:hypothetical protein [Anaerobacillus sp. CMMVII]